MINTKNLDGGNNSSIAFLDSSENSLPNIQHQDDFGELVIYFLAAPAKITDSTGALVLSDPRERVGLTTLWTLYPNGVAIKIESETLPKSLNPKTGAVYDFVIQRGRVSIPLGSSLV